MAERYGLAEVESESEKQDGGVVVDEAIDFAVATGSCR